MKKETLFQRIISWAYMKYVLMPEVEDGGAVLITVLDKKGEITPPKEWEQNTRNVSQAMYEKRFDTEQ